MKMMRTMLATLMLAVFGTHCSLAGSSLAMIVDDNNNGKATDIHVVTSHFALRRQHDHYDEVESAIAANALNPAIAALHVIYEAAASDDCAALRRRLLERIARHWPTTAGTAATAPINVTHADSKLHCHRHGSPRRASFQDVLAIYPHQIHQQLLIANAPGTKRFVFVVLNADVVLDGSARRLRSLRRGHAAVLTVNSGPDMASCCLDGRFQRLVTAHRQSCASSPDGSSPPCAPAGLLTAKHFA